MQQAVVLLPSITDFGVVLEIVMRNWCAGVHIVVWAMSPGGKRLASISRSGLDVFIGKTNVLDECAPSASERPSGTCSKSLTSTGSSADASVS